MTEWRIPEEFKGLMVNNLGGLMRIFFLEDKSRNSFEGETIAGGFIIYSTYYKREKFSVAYGCPDCKKIIIDELKDNECYNCLTMRLK